MAQWPSSSLNTVPGAYGNGMPKPAPSPLSVAPAPGNTPPVVAAAQPAALAAQPQPQPPDSFNRTQATPTPPSVPPPPQLPPASPEGKEPERPQPATPPEKVDQPKSVPATPPGQAQQPAPMPPPEASEKLLEPKPVDLPKPLAEKAEEEKPEEEKKEDKPAPQPKVLPSDVPQSPDVTPPEPTKTPSFLSPHAAPLIPVHAPAGMTPPHISVPHPDMEQVQLRSPVIVNGQAPQLTGNTVAGAALAVGLALFVLPLKMVRKGLAIGGAVFLAGNYLFNKLRNNDNGDQAS